MKISLKINANRQLTCQVDDNGEDIAVTARRCFPWQEPYAHISLTDKDNKEVAMVASLEDLDTFSNAALREVLDVMGFTLQITQIKSIVKEIEIRNWHVETAQGTRTFQTELDEWPREIANGRYIIRDVCGDLYSVDDQAVMDKQSQDLLWRLLE